MLPTSSTMMTRTMRRKIRRTALLKMSRIPPKTPLRAPRMISKGRKN